MAGRTFHSIRNIVFGVADRLVTLLVPFVIRTIMIKTLGAAYLGLSNLFASILTVLSLAELGIGSAMVYAMYRPIAEGNKAAVSGLLNLFRRLYGIVGTVILAGGLGLMPVLPRLIHGGVPDGLNLYIIYLLSLANAVFSYFFGAYKSALVTALQRSDLYSIVHVLVHLVLYAAAIAGLLTTKNYYLYASLFPMATIVQNLILSRTVDRYFGDYFCGGEISRETRSELFHNVLALMGHKVGWLTLYAGMAGGADIILLPEIPYDIDKVIAKIEERDKTGHRFTIVAVAEGAISKEDAALSKKEYKKKLEKKEYPSVSYEVAAQIMEKTGREVRVTVPGHMQRGGSPCPYDRVFASRLGAEAGKLILDNQYGFMVGLKNQEIVRVPLADVAGKLKMVKPDSTVVKEAKLLGISFGD